MKSLAARIARSLVILGVLLAIAIIPAGVGATSGGSRGRTAPPPASSFTTLPSTQRPDTHAPIVKPAGDKGRPAPSIPPRPATSPQGGR